MMLLKPQKDIHYINKLSYGIFAFISILFLNVTRGLSETNIRHLDKPDGSEIVPEIDQPQITTRNVISSELIQNYINSIQKPTQNATSQLLFSEKKKVSVKRAIPHRYYNGYYNKRNGFNRRRTSPIDYADYDYDYLTTEKLRNRRRNQGRRPVGFDDDNYYDYDYEQKPYKWKQQKRRNKNKNRVRNRDPDYYSNENLSDDAERVTVAIKPRQQQTMMPTTTMESTTMSSTTNITNGTTQSSTTSSSTSTPTGYGYGPSSNSENISITYGPPSVPKPLYGIPGSAPGIPINSWPSHTNHYGFSSYYPHSDTNYYHHSSSYHPTSNIYKTVHSVPDSYHENSNIHDYNAVSQASQIDYGLPHSFYGVSNSYRSLPGSHTKYYNYQQHDTSYNKENSYSHITTENEPDHMISGFIATDY